MTNTRAGCLLRSTAHVAQGHALAPWVYPLHQAPSRARYGKTMKEWEGTVRFLNWLKVQVTQLGSRY